MFAQSKSLHTVIVLSLLFTACKKHDNGPQPDPANNVIVETVTPTQKPVSVFINRYVSGYYEALPNHYAVTTKSYPLLVFLHGYGQVGDGEKDLKLVLNDGVAKYISTGKFPGNFNVNGSNYSFIVLSPQMRAYPPDSMVRSFIDYAIKKYRVDVSRIYVAGLSMGGVLTTELAGHYTSFFAAVAPISGESFGDNKDQTAANIAKGNLPLGEFHNQNDPSFPSSAAVDFINLINSYHPVTAPKLTLFPVYGHDAWTQALDPMYKENNMNVYEWMLQYKR